MNMWNFIAKHQRLSCRDCKTFVAFFRESECLAGNDNAYDEASSLTSRCQFNDFLVKSQLKLPSASISFMLSNMIISVCLIYI